MDTKEILIKLKQDTELQARMQATGKNPEEIYAILKEAGLTDSFELFQKTCMTLNESAVNLDGAELDSLAGGFWTTVGDVAYNAAMGLASV